MINISVADQSLIPFVNLFGKLYLGTLCPAVFHNQYQLKKKHEIQSLLNSDSEGYARHYAGQLLNFINHHWQVDQWQYPAVVNTTVSGINWTTGNQRFIVNGLTRNEPWKYFKILLMDNHNLEIENYFEQYVEIKSDLQLIDVLGQDFQSVALNAEIVNDLDHSKLKLTYIGDPKNPSASDYSELGSLLSWQKRYPNPKLKIYTQWPDLITDEHNVWDWKVVGGVDQIKRGIFYPGHLENYVRRQHQENNIGQDEYHHLWVITPRPIDLGDFIFWLDSDHSAFCDCIGDFVLYQPQSTFSSKIISIREHWLDK
jgi:hypothetical protein